MQNEADRQRDRIADLLTGLDAAAQLQPAEIFPHSPTSGFSPATTPAAPADPDFASFAPEQAPTAPTFGPPAGNLFEGDFDPLGNAIDPADMFGGASPNPNGTPGVFDPSGSAINPGNTFAPGPLGDFTTGKANPVGYDVPSGAPQDFNPAAAGDLADAAPGGNEGDQGDGDASGSEGASGGVG